MTTNVERASEVSRNVQIESVKLTDMKMKTRPVAFDSPLELRAGNWFRCRHELRRANPDRVFVYVELKFEASAANKRDVESGALLELGATFLAAYRLPAAAGYPHDALQHFADLNGPYNVWPYWREFVHTSTARAGLPGVIVPVFRPTVRELPSQEELAFAEDVAQAALPNPERTPVTDTPAPASPARNPVP